MDTMPVGTILAVNPTVAKAKKIQTTNNFIINKAFFLFPNIVNLLSAPEKNPNTHPQAWQQNYAQSVCLYANDELLPFDTIAFLNDLFDLVSNVKNGVSN
jgi:hypothetical protein